MSPPTKRMKRIERGTGINDQQSVGLAQHSSGKSSATAMSSPGDQAKTEQLEFELTWKTKDEIICILHKYTTLLSGLIIEENAREKMRKPNVDLMSTLMNLRVVGRSRGFEPLERNPSVGWNEVVLYLSSEFKSRIVDMLIANHYVVLLEPDSVSSEHKAKLVNQNDALICELIKLRVRTGAITSDSSTSKGT